MPADYVYTEKDWTDPNRVDPYSKYVAKGARCGSILRATWGVGHMRAPPS